MKLKYLIIMLILLLSVDNVIAADTWNRNNFIQSGFVIDDSRQRNLGSYSHIEVFEMDSVWYMIACTKPPLPINYGYMWNGSYWVEYNAIVAGMGTNTAASGDFQPTPNYLEMGGSSYLIVGLYRDGNGIIGYKWDGDEWINDNDIQSGIGDSGSGYWSVTTFKKDGEWYLITRCFHQIFTGYIWDKINNTWDYDYDVISGLTGVGNYYGSQEVFEMYGEWYLLSGKNAAGLAGYRHNGSQWVPCDYIKNVVSVTDNAGSPTVFKMDNVYYLMSGMNRGYVYGWKEITFITLNFRDNCGNLLKETEFQYCNHGDTIVCYLVNTSSGTYDISFENQDYLELWVSSADGELYYNISNPQDIVYSVNNPTISWHNNIYVKDGNTSAKIEDALVTFSQDCIIDASSYPSRQKYSNIDGYACFDQCELDMAYITVTATGYKPLSDSISPIYLNAFNLGQTTVATLYPVDDPTNESAMTESGTIATTYIYFKDNSGYYTDSILDIDEYVDLYYYNNNSESAAMTLKFQKYNVYTGLENLLSWNIPYNTSGYKRIYNTNFSDHTYCYYGYLYNAEIEGWNRRTKLSVRNETIEIIDHYQNLSTNLWFENKNSQGDIDYREDISIGAYANSDNSSLLEISLELYDNSIYVDHINLTWADFTGADTEWHYEWKPDHAYADGRNYTVQMHGYDYYLLETDFINASDFRKNKLTIIVKDSAGSNLNNAYVFLEGYGSLSTGISYYNSYEGLDNGNYRYKASKSGYSASGWDNINITDGDEIVCYVLTSDTDNTIYVPKKFDDSEIKLIFFPLIFFLLIMILIGGFKYVSR